MEITGSLKVFTCKHCKGYFVIVDAKDTLIPVNAKADDKLPAGTKFDHKTMRSHLQDCKKRRLDWLQVRTDYEKNPDRRVIAEGIKTIEKKVVKQPTMLPGSAAYKKAQEEFLNKLREGQQNE